MDSLCPTGYLTEGTVLHEKEIKIKLSLFNKSQEFLKITKKSIWYLKAENLTYRFGKIIMRLNFVTVSSVIPFPLWGPDAIHGMLSAYYSIFLWILLFTCLGRKWFSRSHPSGCCSDQTLFLHIQIHSYFPGTHISLKSMCFHSHHALVPEER